MAKKEKWSLKGYDTFEDAFYPIHGFHYSLEGAEDAALKQLTKIEALQPTSTSGGQGKYGIQDQVYIVRPDGTSYRFLPKG